MPEHPATRSRLVVIPAGGLAGVGSRFATYLTYADYLNELAALVGGLRIYAPIYHPDNAEYEYFSQRELDPALCDVVPLDGHSRSQGGATLIGNYMQQMRVFGRDARSWRRVLIYSPSVTAGLAARALKRRNAADCAVYTYVWGDWAELAPHLPQTGMVRKALNPWQQRWILAQERWLVARSRTAWVAGPNLRQRYERVGGDVQETIPMIKMTELLAASPSRDGRDRHTLLYVGRLAPGKGLEIMLEALSLLAPDRPDVKLRLVGNGDRDFVQQLQARATDLGVRERVTLVGVLRNGPELWDEYRRAGMFVLPSLSEGFPRVLYEAMALGTPMVSTAVGSIPAVLQSGRHALLVPPGDLPALLAGIRTVLDAEDGGASLADEARRLFEQRMASGGSSKAQRVAKVILGADRVD